MKFLLVPLAVILFILLELITWVFLLLDHIFFPRFRKTEIKSPLFIIGMPRSATTLCQDMLVHDSRNFTSMKLWEILFAPSIIQKKMAIILKRTDKILKGKLTGMLAKIDRAVFSRIHEIHPASLFNIEEDDFLLLHIFSTPFLAFLFPENKRFKAFLSFDEKVSSCQKRIIMGFYRNCIKRHLYVFGNGRRYLTKNPSHTPRLRSLCRTFPEVKFIYMLRDPVDSLASTMNMYRHYGRVLKSKITIAEIFSRAISFADIYYRYPLLTCSDLLGNSMFICHFDEITSDPVSAARKIYAQVRIEPPEVLMDYISRESEVKKHKASSRYTAEEFGLDKHSLSDRYYYVYEDHLHKAGQAVIRIQ